jgi:hypothetical protein
MHGLMDDALYGMGSTPFLFLLPVWGSRLDGTGARINPI